MKYIIVKFTCARDLAMLFANHDWSAPVYWVVDRRHYEEFQSYTLPPNVTLLVSDFHRQGNLNGVECVRGIYTIYKRLFEETGAERIFKVDSDTRLLNPEVWLAMPRKWMTCVKYPTFDSGLGCCMMFDKSIINKDVEAGLAALNPVYRHPEDFAFCNVARPHRELELLPLDRAAFPMIRTLPFKVDDNTLFINVGNAT